MIPLPAYIDQEAWLGFVEMRKSMPKSKPFTTRAATLILYQLQRLKDAGHDPNASLDQSTINGWADVYAPKSREVTQAARSSVDETKDFLARQAACKPNAELARAARLKVVGR